MLVILTILVGHEGAWVPRTECSAERKMDFFDERDKRERLAGLRLCLQALEPGGGFVLKQQGKIVNTERAEELRRHIAYLEAILPPKRKSASDDV
jgi:hypothetical protein